MQVTADTKISEVLKRYGDIADVMETFGVKRVGKYNFRRLLGKALTVKRAAFAHRITVDEMVHALQSAIDKVHADEADGAVQG
jgi:hypothetical protein